ncbi:ATP-dependent RNA helicase DHX58 [Pseudochaenichthys georgianus]|uniref:ATP-dependent RNA helicase DHX58 n=1 Tax=Pseudochaenichthys georgianus TaxID=52239 RepID=UPI00146D7B75|nr:probable ATP-dependent RNA helicase DHX58 [Pseudochaenichthys georgianus]
MEGFELYAYQKEVAERALHKENIIIWLPTGGGKTRAAVYVAKKHLKATPRAKVVVLVNKVHLVDQHYKNEFEPHLGRDYKVLPVSGETVEKDFFGKVLQEKDVVICTAQLLHNALISKEEDRHVDLSDITLLIIDECHHTNKEGVYNKVMTFYLEKKLKGEKSLPQILGLTASPGTGGATDLHKAVEHVLQICANLDSAIVSTKNFVTELNEKVPRPKKQFDIVDARPKDPFGDQLKSMMLIIHEFMNIPPDFRLRQCGTQEYEADVVELEKRGVKKVDRLLAQCALHLRQYNDALLINDTLRMTDAYLSLEDFYSKITREIDGTDIFLVGLFQENQVELEILATDSRYGNPKMDKLKSTLLEQFVPSENSKGIIFSKTRKSTHCLNDWVLNDKELKEAGIKPAILTGAGNSISHMTLNEQSETIRKFRRGAVNLLVSTSVAEEGLDIPECNLVVRYGLLTNEIAQQQASGRARAKDSLYSVVAQKGGREVRREHTNDYLKELTEKAITKVQEMSPREFSKKIAALQREAAIQRSLDEKLKMEKRSRYPAASVNLVCRSCFTSVASGSDLRLLDGVHYVNVNPDFEKNYKVGGQVVLEKSFEDWEPGCKVCCRECDKDWGFEMKYKGDVLLPNLSIKNLALDTPNNGRLTLKKWKDIPFIVEDFSYEEYCNENHPDFFD